jgi:DNA uptake protein ComE-like DNA-binding protein
MEESPVYQAACHGPPLTSVEQRNQALEDGYEINRTYGCIDKASYLAMLDQQARAALASTPEALAKAEADRLRRVAEARLQADEDRSAQASTLMRSALSPVDVNSASEFEIARVPTVGADVAAEIIRERARRPFSDWLDLVNRVVGLSAAQTAVSASACGLTVDGASLPGVDPTGAAGPQLCARMQPASGY